jgi:hypothetical protein
MFKLCITGVLCIIAQGSAFQVVLALVVCLINASLLLRFAPYDSESADALAIACALCLSMTVLGGYVLMANETMRTVNPMFVDYGLIGLNIVPLVLFVVNVVRLKMNHGKRILNKVPPSTAVVPIEQDNVDPDAKLKDWK